jgi:hypothetical protein
VTSPRLPPPPTSPPPSTPPTPLILQHYAPQIKEDTTSVDAMYGVITGLAWTDDGQILTVATQSGTLLNYLAKIPNIVDSCGLRVAHLSSLREMSVSDTTGDSPTLVLPVSVEPSFVALGPQHVAVRACPSGGVDAR